MDARKSAIFVFQFAKPVLQTITHLLQITVLEIQFWSVKCTMLLYDTQKYWAFPFLPIKRCKRLQWLHYMKTNHFKILLNVFSTTYTYSNYIIYRLFGCWKRNLSSKISKIRMNLWMVYNCKMKSSGKYTKN